ncbi:MAG TPA: hypothetical protein VJ767_02685 [Nitrososphaeraceae archaeon]|nr:hypothetical protein [Nitrososphaeraceae archaeon]
MEFSIQKSIKKDQEVRLAQAITVTVLKTEPIIPAINAPSSDSSRNCGTIVSNQDVIFGKEI